MDTQKKTGTRCLSARHVGQKSIEEVTDASGFVSAAHFARLFKEQYQMTPTEYRGRNDE
nr:AraC family transcriptional regulator [Bacteroides fragilis]